MNQSKQINKSKQNYQVVNESQSTGHSLAKINLNSIQVQALLAEQQRCLKVLEDKKNKDTKQFSTVDNFSTVLTQSLTTKDQELIFFTLANDDEQLIKNTLQSLPSSKASQLLSVIHEALLSKPYNAHFYSKWLKHLLILHTTTLVNKSNLPLINNLKQLLSTRTKNITQLTKLKGKLSILVEQNKRTQTLPKKLPKKVIKQIDQEQINEDQNLDQMDLEDFGQQQQLQM